MTTTADLLTVAQAATRLGLSLARVYELCASGRLRSTRFGVKTLLVDSVSVEEYGATPHKSGPPPGTPRPPRR